MSLPPTNFKPARANRLFKANGRPRFRKVWTSPIDVFLPDLRNYYQHGYYHADSGFELTTTEGLRQCLLTRQWDAGLQLVILLHQLQEPPFELLWKAGMACLQGKIFEEEELLQSNPFLPRKYPRTLLTDYLSSLFDLPNSEPFHVLLNYELALHLLYVHEDPLQVYEFLENLIYSHPYSELPFFLLLMATLALYLAQLQFTYSNTPTPDLTTTLTSSYAFSIGSFSTSSSSSSSSFMNINIESLRYLNKAKAMFTKLNAMGLTSLDYNLYFQHYHVTLPDLMQHYKGIAVSNEDGGNRSENDPFDLPVHSLQPCSLETSSTSFSSLSASSSSALDQLESLLSQFDFRCSDKSKWRELVTILSKNKEHIPDLFKYRRTWWFPFHFSFDESDHHLLTYKSIIAYWAVPEIYVHIKKKIWKNHKSVPKDLHYFFGKLKLRIRDIACSYAYQRDSD